MLFRNFTILLLVVFLSSCSFFKTQNTIQNLYYDKEIQSKLEEAQSENLIIEEDLKIEKSEEKTVRKKKLYSRPTNYIEISYNALDPEYKKLLAEAFKVMENSYSPYFKFMVGAALLTDDGKTYTGTNVENAAGSSVCAERSAIFKAVSEGHKNFKAIAIVGKGHSFESEDIVAPCGPCRQVIYEFADLNDTDIKVIMSNSTKTKIVISTISELLPLAFGPKDLS